MDIRRAAGTACVAIALAGCGGGGGGTPEPGGGGGGPAANDIFPLALGHRWVGIDPQTGQGEYMTRVTAVAREGASEVFTLTGFAADGRRDQTVLRRSATALYADPDPADPEYLRGLGPLKLMQMPLVPGEGFAQILPTVVDLGEDLDGDGRSESAAIESRVTVIGFERVVLDTGVGPWNDCLHLRTELTLTVFPSGGGSQTTVRTVGDDWYAPGIGPVRQEIRVDGVGLVFLDRLTGYAVGALRSDTRAPVVTERLPLPGARIASPALYRLRVDEALDPYALQIASPVLRLDDGAAVAGRWLLESSRELIFAPDAPLRSGRYRVEANGIEDRFGNRPDLSDWTFEVDATAPQLVAVTPVDGSVDVPVTGRLTVRFDEPVAADSIHFTLQPVGGGVPASLTATREDGGRTVHLDTVVPLAWATEYELSFAHTITDTLGNPLQAPPPVRLRTVAGRFEAGRPLALASPVTASAVADLSGDGRADLVVATLFGNAPETDHRVLLFAQQPDGSLGPARELPAGSGLQCRPFALATGEFTGDGRTDLLVWRENCGLRLLRQTADGDFVAAWDEVVPGLLAVDDLDGDGRPEAITYDGSGSRTLARWPIAADGRLGAAVPIATASLAVRGLAIGDLDGDGRRDLALIDGELVQVLRQLPGGGFAPGASLPPVIHGNAPMGIAAADLDGDGRVDLAYTTVRDTLAWRLQQADGTPGPEQTLPLAYRPSALRAVDLSADGRADLVVGHDQQPLVSVVLQRVDGSLAPAERYPLGPVGYPDGAQKLAFGDLDGNGRVDIVAAESRLHQPGPPPSGAARSTPLAAARRALVGR